MDRQFPKWQKNTPTESSCNRNRAGRSRDRRGKCPPPTDFCSTRNKTFSFKRRFIFSSPPPRFFNLPSSLRKEIMTRLRSTPMVDTHVTKMSTMRLKPLLNRICFLFVFSFFDRETWLTRSKEYLCCCHCQVTIMCH